MSSSIRIGALVHRKEEINLSGVARQRLFFKMEMKYRLVDLKLKPNFHSSDVTKKINQIQIKANENTRERERKQPMAASRLEQLQLLFKAALWRVTDYR